MLYYKEEKKRKTNNEDEKKTKASYESFPYLKQVLKHHQLYLSPRSKRCTVLCLVCVYRTLLSTPMGVDSVVIGFNMEVQPLVTHNAA